jgi:hypothetical protein
MALTDLRAGGSAGDSRAVLGMAGILVAAVAVAILPIQGKEAGGDLLRVPGYTASLALAVFPLVPLLLWLRLGGEARRVQRQAFGLTALVVVPFWTALDVGCAHLFFTFPNAEATLGLNIPGWHPATGWGLNIPFEELAFYLLSCLVMVLIYAWSSERWFGVYDEPASTYQRHAALCIERIRIDWRKVGYVSGLFLAVVAYKWFGAHEHREGFPWYAAVLLMGGLLPNFTIYPAVARFINKQAMLFTMTVVVLLSLLWEVTLGLPNGWWGYQTEPMMGIFLSAWHDLPIEAAFLWLMAGWGNIVLFEFFRMKLHSGRRTRDLLGSQAPIGAGPPAPGAQGPAASPPNPAQGTPLQNLPPLPG